MSILSSDVKNFAAVAALYEFSSCHLFLCNFTWITMKSTVIADFIT